MNLKPSNKAITKVYLAYLVVLTFTIIGALILHFATQEPKIIWSLALAINLLLWIIPLPLTILWIKKLAYEIKPKNVTIYQGIISKTEQNINFSKITDFQLHRSLFDRWLNIASIRIQTAGQAANNTSGYEGVLIGLENWQEIYPDLKDKINDEKPENSEPTNSTEEILVELKLIRQLLEKARK
ncbi:MAG: PH domain-containing protein [Candidatus Cloacimonadales bacterium]